MPRRNELVSTRTWEFSSLLRGQNLSALFENTIWSGQVADIESRFDSAVQDQDREFLDAVVPTEMVVYGAAAAGLNVYRSDNGYIRSTSPGKALPLAWVIARYGAAFAEAVMEAGLASEPS